MLQPAPLKGKQASLSMPQNTCMLRVWHESDINLIQGILIKEQKNTKVHFFSITFTLACEDVKCEISFSASTLIPLNLEPG